MNRWMASLSLGVVTIQTNCLRELGWCRWTIDDRFKKKKNKESRGEREMIGGVGSRGVRGGEVGFGEGLHFSLLRTCVRMREALGRGSLGALFAWIIL